MAALLLAAAPGASTIEEGLGGLPIHLAAFYRHTAVMQLLLAAAPATAGALSSFFRTPLHWTALRGDPCLSICCLKQHQRQPQPWIEMDAPHSTMQQSLAQRTLPSCCWRQRQ